MLRFGVVAAMAAVAVAATGCGRDDVVPRATVQHTASIAVLSARPAAPVVQPAAFLGNSVDVAGTATAVTQVPNEIAALRRVIAWTGIAVLVVGGLNAWLLWAILSALRRRSSASMAAAAVTPLSASLWTPFHVTAAQPQAAASAHEYAAPVTQPYASLVEVPQAAPVTVADQPADESPACACGAPISPRSRSGLCRSCARINPKPRVFVATQ